MGFVKENGKMVYHRKPGQKRISDMTPEERVRDINSRRNKVSPLSARQLLEIIESGKCTPNFPSEEVFEEWKADVLVGKYDGR